ncbi:UNVERIFIED_CONTAM: hypothetical protein Sradi_1538000 [Sesamum radiatum]|uniref:CCHC-type domain-containing protein n=1 Tax=Sesamum radiatum TaxID=300843 RepID=A0AAW2U8W4_SESRA
MKKGKGTAVAATASTRGAPAAPTGKGIGKVGGSQRSRVNKCMHCHEKGHWKRECPQLLSNLSSGKKHKTSKDEMVLRLGDGKTVVAEAVGSLSLTTNRIRKLVDSKSLEIDDLDHLPTCESCLKGKMTKKSIVGQSAIANSLLDLVHTDVCGPLNTPTRGGFSYFIPFTDDHSRYGYVYLMRYKSEAFGRFKEYRLKVEN